MVRKATKAYGNNLQPHDILLEKAKRGNILARIFCLHCLLWESIASIKQTTDTMTFAFSQAQSNKMLSTGWRSFQCGILKSSAEITKLRLTASFIAHFITNPAAFTILLPIVDSNIFANSPIHDPIWILISNCFIYDFRGLGQTSQPQCSRCRAPFWRQVSQLGLSVALLAVDGASALSHSGLSAQPAE